MFTRFRDIAAFVLQNATFPYPTSSLPKNYPTFPWNYVDRFLATKSKGVIIAVQLVSKISNLYDHKSPTSQTDRRTDERTDDMRSQDSVLH